MSRLQPPITVTGVYVYDKETRSMRKVADKVFRGRFGDDERPFREKVMEGFKRIEAKGGIKSAWKANRIKALWGKN